MEIAHDTQTGAFKWSHKFNSLFLFALASFPFLLNRREVCIEPKMGVVSVEHW